MSDFIYSTQTSVSAVLSASTSTSSTLNFALLYGAGLITSFSPCALGLLPVTMSYISTAAGEREDKTALLPTVAFALGLASVFCGLGLSAALLGGVFGSKSATGSVVGTTVLALGSSGISVAMGLQILDLIQIPLPSFEGPTQWFTDKGEGGVAAAAAAVGGGGGGGSSPDASFSIVIDDDGNISPAMICDLELESFGEGPPCLERSELLEESAS